MELLKLEIKNFRGIKEGTIFFNSHTLLIGGNNVGKSTICEAIDLILGPERLSRSSVLNENDFYNRQYLDDNKEPIIIEINAIIASLSTEVLIKFRANHRYWDTALETLVDIDATPEDTDREGAVPVLPVTFKGFYDKDDDEFKAETSFLHPLKDESQPLDSFRRTHKRNFGFLFLRTLRTGSRALSMEKGSLLDVILRLKEDDKTEMWEKSIKALETLEPPIHSLDQLSVILDQVENRINNFIKLGGAEQKLGFFVSNLTREKLRSIITFFATSEYNDTLVPFHQLGTGAINTLVFSMLTFIADLKSQTGGNVIFAMEEPEIALPPHTQRRIIRYVLKDMDQAIFTTHSPYVIEQFAPENIVILSKSNDGIISSKPLNLEGVRAHTFKGGIKHKYAEALLGKGVLLVEGKTEEDMFPALSDVIEQADPEFLGLDIAGITVVEVHGDGQLIKHAKLFIGFGLDVFAFYDKQSDSSRKEELEKCTSIQLEIDYDSIEKLLVEEIPISRLKSFLDEIKERSDFPKNHLIDWSPFSDDELKDLTYKVLKARKGYGYAALLIHQSTPYEIPLSLSNFIQSLIAPYKFVAKKPFQ
ncbi:MAG: AAA family ATPase [Cyclobacteriaceae bacterium]